MSYVYQFSLAVELTGISSLSEIRREYNSLLPWLYYKLVTDFMNFCSNPPAETIKFLRTLRLYFDNGFTIDRLLDLSYLRIFQYEGALRSIVDDGELDLSILAVKRAL